MHRTRYLLKFASLSVMSSPMLLGVGCLVTGNDVTGQVSKALQGLLTGLFGAAVSALFAGVFPN